MGGRGGLEVGRGRTAPMVLGAGKLMEDFFAAQRTRF